MKFLNKLEKYLGRFAIRGLMTYLCGMYAVGFFLGVVYPMFYEVYLSLEIEYILRGELWRLITWLAYPPSFSPFFGLLLIFMYYNLGHTLERVWGTFRFNLFMFSGIILHIIAAFILYFVFQTGGLGWQMTPDNLNMSIFIAYALTFPEMQFYLFFTVPIKAKVLAYGYIIIEVLNFFTGLPAQKVSLAISMLNFIIFFMATRRWNRISPAEIKRKHDFKIKAKPVATVHKCAVCGRTEKDAPDLEFRYCSKCNGNYEYCSDHLYTHKHME